MVLCHCTDRTGAPFNGKWSAPTSTTLATYGKPYAIRHRNPLDQYCVFKQRNINLLELRSHELRQYTFRNHNDHNKVAMSDILWAWPRALRAEMIIYAHND